jgi:uncharacterized protein
MLSAKDIESKSQLELIKHLVDDLKGGEVRQLSLLKPLAKACIAKQGNSEVDTIFSELMAYCQERKTTAEDQEKGHLLFIQGWIHNHLLNETDKQVSEAKYQQAIQFYDQAIALGNASAMNSRAYMHEKGINGPVDYVKAIQLYDQAMELGDASAMSNRATMHRKGRGGAVDCVKAIQLYDQAIALGHASAMNKRAYMHKKGLGGPVNYAKATQLYDQAIAFGHASAMYNRAIMHKKGQGGSVDYAKAVQLYDQAIALDDASAMTDRATMHKKGQGGPIDNIKAARLYRQAYESGYDKGLTLLNKRDAIPFNYHRAMAGNDSNKAVELLKTHLDDLIAEFTEFDCAINRKYPRPSGATKRSPGRLQNP